MSKEVEALKRITNEINTYKLHGLGDNNWLGFQDVMEDIDIIENFIAQQEKVNELLDLYKTVFKNYVVEIDNVRQQQFTFLASEYKIIKGIFIQIEELESELNEMVARFYKG